MLLTRVLTASDDLQYSLRRRHPHPESSRRISDNIRLKYMNHETDELYIYVYNLLLHISQREDETEDPREEPCRLVVEEVLLSLHLESLCLITIKSY